MFDNYLIEIDDRAAGIIVRAGRVFSFHAVEAPFASLEGVTFPGALSAERAARRLLRRRKRPIFSGPRI